jgi:hypothetical protein
VLEELERGENIAKENHWGWLYRFPVTFNIISSLLVAMTCQPSHPAIPRAWRQIDIVFDRHNNDDVNMSKIPAWKAIENLCDQVMFYYPTMIHEGTPHARRRAVIKVEGSKGPSRQRSLGGSEDGQMAMFDDVAMFNQDADSLVIPNLFTTPSDRNISGLTFGQWNHDNGFPPSAFQTPPSL